MNERRMEDMRAYCEAEDKITDWKYVMSFFFDYKNHYIYRCKSCFIDRLKSELVEKIEDETKSP